MWQKYLPFYPKLNSNNKLIFSTWTLKNFNVHLVYCIAEKFKTMISKFGLQRLWCFVSNLHSLTKVKMKVLNKWKFKINICISKVVETISISIRYCFKNKFIVPRHQIIANWIKLIQKLWVIKEKFLPKYSSWDSKEEQRNK